MKRDLLYKASDGPNLHLAERRKAKAKRALGWAMIIAGVTGIVFLVTSTPLVFVTGMTALASLATAGRGLWLVVDNE